MNKLNHYRQIIQNIVTEHAQYKQSHKEIERILFLDFECDDYSLMSVEIKGIRRVKNLILHLRIYEGKIRIECEKVQYEITHNLLDAGIPKEDIVLAFHDPETRAHIPGFAIA